MISTSLRDYKTAHSCIDHFRRSKDGKCVFPQRMNQITSRPQSHDCSLWVTNIPLLINIFQVVTFAGQKENALFKENMSKKNVSSLCWPSTSMHGQTTISDSIVLLRWTRPPIRPQECVCLCILFFVFVHLLGVFGWASYQVYMPLCIFLCICVFLSGTSQMVSPTEYSINLSDARSEQLDSIRQNHCKWYQRFFALLNIQCFETSLLSGNVCFSSQSTSG